MEASNIDWVSFENSEQVQQVLLDSLGEKANENDIKNFASKQNLECSEPAQKIIYCSARASGKWKLIREKWLIEFHMLKGRVDTIKVDKGYIGP